MILYGVRTFLGELIPAFQGIAKKVVPGAKAALDIPIVFPYGQNAVLIGFISSFVGGLVMLVLLATWLGPAFGFALILPGMVPHFFCGGGAGVYGNATGGRRGAVLGGFVNGVIITILPALLYAVMNGVASMFNQQALAGSTYGDADFGWFGSLIGAGVLSGSAVATAIITLVIGAVILTLAILWQVKVVNKGWMPGEAHAQFVAEVKAEQAAAAKAEREAARAERARAKDAAADGTADA